MEPQHATIRRQPTISHRASNDGPDSYRAEARRLLRSVDADQWGDVDPSIYETARVMALAPWVPGQARRIRWLPRTQSADGTWGTGPKPYQLLPTLSAVDAALTCVVTQRDLPPGTRDPLAAAAAAGLAALRALGTAGPRPDTAAIELIVPGLVRRVNNWLDRPELTGLPHLAAWHRGSRIPIPPGYDPTARDRLRHKLAHLDHVPTKLHHTFEAIAQYCPDDVLPEPAGLLGSSPAATAAWTTRVAGADQSTHTAVSELNASANRYGGLFPEAVPLTVVERLWVLSALLRAGLPSELLVTARTWASSIYDPRGVRGAPGLAPDADDTGMCVHICAALGVTRDPAPLALFENATHFDCYVGEDTDSVTANAHVLQALVSYLRRCPQHTGRHSSTIAKVRDWLLDQRTEDGYWTDKWHASPYYATAHCVAALTESNNGSDSTPLDTTADWVARTQRPDGSWGIWSGTAEETAYAVQTLLHTRSTASGAALTSAQGFLADTQHDPTHRHPAMWHGKTLYTPNAIIRAELLATSALLATAPDTNSRVRMPS
jgi:hypothetical protein